MRILVSLHKGFALIYILVHDLESIVICVYSPSTGSLSIIEVVPTVLFDVAQWELTGHGNFSTSSAVELIRDKQP